MTRWPTSTKLCPDCGNRFRRWNPKSGTVSAGGVASGCAYCRPCMGARALAWRRAPSGVTETCATCAADFPLTNRDLSERRRGVRPVIYCSVACRAGATRKWRDSHEG